jgi:DNA replication protein DnaC
MRFPYLTRELEIANDDGRYPKILKSLAKIYVFVIDDFALDPLTVKQRRNLLEILEERYDLRSTIVTSQLPVNKWHEMIGDPTTPYSTGSCITLIRQL